MSPREYPLLQSRLCILQHRLILHQAIRRLLLEANTHFEPLITPSQVRPAWENVQMPASVAGLGHHSARGSSNPKSMLGVRAHQLPAGRAKVQAQEALDVEVDPPPVPEPGDPLGQLADVRRRDGLGRRAPSRPSTSRRASGPARATTIALRETANRASATTGAMMELLLLTLCNFLHEHNRYKPEQLNETIQAVMASDKTVCLSLKGFFLIPFIKKVLLNLYNPGLAIITGSNRY